MFKESIVYDDLTLKVASDKVKSFQADFGGTEIYSPLDDIFNQINSQPKKENKTHIYLLTDGAVHNNGPIIDLIKKNCTTENTTRLHTFGVGSGADENLIKGCAFSGMGNFSFIYKDEEIEDKVIESLSKTKLEYLLVTHAKIMDEDDELIEELSNLPLPLQAATMFEWQTLLVDKAKAAVFSCTIYDPNTLMSSTYSR